MSVIRRWTAAGAALAVGALTVAFADRSPDVPGPEANAGAWKIEATGVRVIGGYGDNFAYDGDDVRPLEGWAEMEVDHQAGTARLTLEVKTTPESGPIRYSKDQHWEGTVRIVQQINTSEMDMARIAQDVLLHGDTGNEAPVMPAIYNYFATWGPSKIWVNGEEVISMVGSHTMFSEQARGADGIIKNDSGEVYSPRLAEKTGFTAPQYTEFHYVAHTTQPDSDNFPPHSGWIHLHFSSVVVGSSPDGFSIPGSALAAHGLTEPQP